MSVEEDIVRIDENTSETTSLLRYSETSSGTSNPNLYNISNNKIGKNNGFLNSMMQGSRASNGYTSTTFLLLNAMIGSGILNQAEVFRDAGIIPTTLIYIIVFPMVWFGVLCITSVYDVLRIETYGGIARAGFGRGGHILMEASIISNAFGALLSYFVLIGNLSSDCINYWFNGISDDDAEDDGVYADQEITFVLLIALIVIFPLCLIRDYAHLSHIAYFSMFAIGSVCLLVIIGAPFQSNNDESDALNWGSLEGSLTSFGSVIFALSYTYTTIQAFRAMDTSLISSFSSSNNNNNNTSNGEKKQPIVTTKSSSFYEDLFSTMDEGGIGLLPEETNNTGAFLSPKLVQFRKVTFFVSLIGCLSCWLTGLMGYVSFRNETSDDILSNFSTGFSTIFKTMIVIHLILFIPGEFVIMRDSILSLSNKFMDHLNMKSHIVFTFILLSIPLLIVCTLFATGVGSGNLFGDIVELTGSIGFSINCFILPGLLYLELLPQNAPYSTHAKFIVFGGCFSILLVPIAFFAF